MILFSKINFYYKIKFLNYFIIKMKKKKYKTI